MKTIKLSILCVIFIVFLVGCVDDSFDINGNLSGDADIDVSLNYPTENEGKWVLQTESETINDDGELKYTRQYFYDAYGNVIKREYDSENDGIIDEIAFFEYDYNSNCTKREYDYNNDGVIDHLQIYEYDIYGNQILSKNDYDADGIFDQIQFYTWKFIE